jgi:hypothetical protein
MTTSSLCTFNPRWRILLHDVGIPSDQVLHRSGLPGDLFERGEVLLRTEECLWLWRHVVELSGDPAFQIRVGENLSMEALSFPVVASLCSPDLNTALVRLARYKRLVVPMELHVDRDARGTALSFEWPRSALGAHGAHGVHEKVPSSLVTMELVFFVQLARLATRTRVTPLVVTAPHPPEPKADYATYLGVTVRRGEKPTILFSIADATRPFLTANEEMWDVFEPELEKRIAELNERSRSSELSLHDAGLIGEA